MAGGEGLPLLAAAGAHFCLLSGYYMLRSVREAMALEAGREHIPLLFTLTFFVMLVLLPVYWWVVARVRRDRLASVLYLPVVTLFLVIAAFVLGGRLSPALAGTYFVGVTAMNLFVVSIFWSLMADLWSPDAAKRLFGFVAAGGSAGALAGPAFNALFVERVGAGASIVLACMLLATAAVLVSIAQHRRAAADPQRAPDPRLRVGGRARDDLARLVRSPYLLGIAGLIVGGQILGAFMYNEQARYVESAFTTLTERAALFARIDLAVNVLALVFQSLVVGWLTVRAGIGTSLAALWAIGCASFVLLALVPTGTVLLATQVLRRAGDYGLFKPAREMLFTVLQPQSKFKSKSLLDTVLQRGADSVGNGLYLLVAGLGLASIAWLSAAACVLLLLGARRLGTAFADRERRAANMR